LFSDLSKSKRAMLTLVFVLRGSIAGNSMPTE